MKPSSIYSSLRTLLASDDLSVADSMTLPARPPKFGGVPEFLSESSVGAYLKSQIGTRKSKSHRLWSHQSQALALLGEKSNLVISTSTATGKSLVFRAIAFHKILTDPKSRVLVFYPLKALVSDQLIGWHTMATNLGLATSTVNRIDGSVPVTAREKILQSARIIVMTPDVCHAWLMARLSLPNVKKYVRDVSMIVLDEAHTLEGVFGSNFAFLIRRLITARNYLRSSYPQESPLQFVAATATIDNPKDHMEKLTGAKFSVVDHSSEGAPAHERLIVHVECEENEELEIANRIHNYLLIDRKNRGLITFVDSRKSVEDLAMKTEKKGEGFMSKSDVLPYRAGYIHEDRQKIELLLQKKRLRAVISTSALELGIDIPHLHVGINVGIPSSRKAYRQRLGRVGRSGPGAFILIAPRDAFSRYGMSFREYHELPVEPTRYYLDNRFVQFANSRCLLDELDALKAPRELPSKIGWPSGFNSVYPMARPGSARPPEFDAIAELGGDTPQRNYPLRNIGDMSFEIKLGEFPEALGVVSLSQALRECYPGATYLHLAKPYFVSGWSTVGYSPVIRVKKTKKGRITKPHIRTWINTGINAGDLVEGHLLRGENGLLSECRMQITERVEGYTVLGSNEYQPYTDLRQKNPNMRARMRNFRTTGIVFNLSLDWFKDSIVKNEFASRIVEIFIHEYSILPQDIGYSTTNIAVRDRDLVHRTACVVVFDQTYGSLRLTEQFYLHFDDILERLIMASKNALPASQQLFDFAKRVKDHFVGFSPVSSFVQERALTPQGFEQVFKEGSRVCYRQHGPDYLEVEVVRPTMMNGHLMYQVKERPRPGQAPVLRWIEASKLEPSGDAEGWEYAWWNRSTETFEDPQDHDTDTT